MHIGRDTLTAMGVAPANADRHLAQLNEALPRFGIDTPLRVAHFLAQVAHESIRLSAVEERISEAKANRNYGNRRDLGNDRPGDGWRYRGRGLIQLTGKANYRSFDGFLRNAGIHDDVVANPDLVASRFPVHSAVWYWNSRNINAAADRDDVEAVTRKVNGGLRGFADRRELLARAKRALGVERGQQPKPPAGLLSGKASDETVDLVFGLGWAQGNPGYWKALPAESGEWADFWRVTRKRAVELDRAVRPGDRFVDLCFAAGWARGDPGYWKRLPDRSVEWADFWRAVDAATG